MDTIGDYLSETNVCVTTSAKWNIPFYFQPSGSKPHHITIGTTSTIIFTEWKCFRMRYIVHVDEIIRLNEGGDIIKKGQSQCIHSAFEDDHYTGGKILIRNTLSH